MAYRDDLEATRARVDVLEREVAELKRRNAELEDEVQRVWEQTPQEPPEPVMLVQADHTPPQRRFTASGTPMLFTGTVTAIVSMWFGAFVLGVLGIGIALLGAFLTRR